MSHTCHAEGCKTEIHPRLLMCSLHWQKVPKWLQEAIWATYVPGQWRTKTPTKSYLIVQARARLAVAQLEGRPTERCWLQLKLAKFIPELHVDGLRRRDAVGAIDAWIRDITERAMASESGLDLT